MNNVVRQKTAKNNSDILSKSYFGPKFLMENQLPQFSRVGNFITFMEDNCVTLWGKLLKFNISFLTAFERKNCLTEQQQQQQQQQQNRFFVVVVKVQSLQNNAFVVYLELAKESFCTIFMQHDNKQHSKTVL